jgi:hypothetical protein
MKRRRPCDLQAVGDNVGRGRRNPRMSQVTAGRRATDREGRASTEASRFHGTSSNRFLVHALAQRERVQFGIGVDMSLSGNDLDELERTFPHPAEPLPLAML